MADLVVAWLAVVVVVREAAVPSSPRLVVAVAGVLAVDAAVAELVLAVVAVVAELMRAVVLVVREAAVPSSPR